MQEAGLLLAAATRENVSPAVVLELLKRIGGIIKVQTHCLLLCPRRTVFEYTLGV